MSMTTEAPTPVVEERTLTYENLVKYGPPKPETTPIYDALVARLMHTPKHGPDGKFVSRKGEDL